MKIIRPQQSILLSSPHQIGGQHSLGISVVMGWYLGRPESLVHEATLWAALAAAPMSLRILDAAEPKPYAEWLLAGHATATTAAHRVDIDIHVGAVRKSLVATIPGMAMDDDARFERVSLDHAGAWLAPTEATPRSPRIALRDAHGQAQPGVGVPGTTPVPHQHPARMSYQCGPEAYGAAYLATEYPGWPATIDRRCFQMAPADQWAATASWPCSVPYRLNNFAAHGAPMVGTTPAIHARVLAWPRGDGANTVDIPMARKTLWFLPDAGIGLVVFSGAVPMKHALGEPFDELLLAWESDGAVRAKAYYEGVRARRADLRTGALESMLDDELTPPNAELSIIATLADHPSSVLHVAGGSEPASAAEHYAQARRSCALVASAMAPASTTEAIPTPTATPGAIAALRKSAPGGVIADLVFHDEIIEGESLAGRMFRHCDFIDCRINSTDFSKACFDSCRFVDCLIGKSDLRECRVTGCETTRTVIEDTVLGGSAWSGSSLTKCVITDCDMRGMTMSGCLFLDGETIHCRLDGARLDKTLWTQCRLSGLTMDDAILEGCTFEGCTVEGCDFIGATIERSSVFQGAWCTCRFERASFDRVTFGAPLTMSTCTFDKSRLRKVGLTGVSLTQAKFTHCVFDEVSLVKADLRQADIAGCDFLVVMMREANLAGARITGTAMGASSIYGADLRGMVASDCDFSGCDMALVLRDDATRLDECLCHDVRLVPECVDGKVETV